MQREVGEFILVEETSRRGRAALGTLSQAGELTGPLLSSEQTPRAPRADGSLAPGRHRGLSMGESVCRVNDGRKTEAETSLKPAGSKVVKSGNVRVT